MDFEILLTSFSSVVLTLATIWLKEYVIPKKLHNNLTENSTNSYIKLNQTCREIRTLFHADGVFIAQFHNGGSYSNGVHMNKFTVVGEDYEGGLKSYKRQYNATHCNTVSYLIHDLVCSNKHIIEDINEHVFNDHIYEEDLTERNIRSTHSFLIKEAYSKKPLGFISLEFKNPTKYVKATEDSIWKFENDIAAILNRKKIK